MKKNCRHITASASYDDLLHTYELLCFRGQLLIAIKTEISDSIDTAPSEVEVEQTQTINEAVYNKNEDFFMFGTILDATMIDKK